MIKLKRYFNEIVVVLKRNGDVLILVTIDIENEFRTDYLKK